MVNKNLFSMGKISNKFLLFPAVQKYYDQWGRIASRHEHWSTPEYYHEAEEKVRKRQEQEEKQSRLSVRQERLKTQLTAETVQQDSELRGQSRLCS